jgi:hypothetical protein
MLLSDSNDHPSRNAFSSRPRWAQMFIPRALLLDAHVVMSRTSANEPHTGSACPIAGLVDGVPCPRGQYCPVRGLVGGMPCAWGRFNPLLGMNSSTACVPCALGLLASPDNAVCVSVCPVGSYVNVTAAQCVMCPGGVFCLGSVNPALPCPAGT